MDLPPLMATHYQRSLFDFEDITEHSARNWVGDFFEQATANVSSAVRYKDSSQFKICPDLGWGPLALFEVKGVGRSNSSIIYQGRLKKDRELVDANNVDLHYWFWRHSHAVKQSPTKQQLRTNLAAATYQVLVVDLAEVERYCWSRQVKVLNTAYTKAGAPLKYGSTEKGYGLGWSVSMKQMLARCEQRTTVPQLSVYGTQLHNVEVYTSREIQGRFIMSFGSDPKSKYLYAFEREVDRLVCVHNFCAPEPFCMFGEHGFVTELFTQRPGLKDGKWVNAHMYYGSLSAEEGAARWFNECCLPIIKRNRKVPEQKKLKESFNIYPDGGPSSQVVGVGFGEYKQNNSLAVFLIFKSGEGQPISVNVPEHTSVLEEGQFFIKDWSELKHVAERLQQVGLVTILDKPRVATGHVEVATAVVNRNKLTDFSAEELARYKP